MGLSSPLVVDSKTIGDRDTTPEPDASTHTREQPNNPHVNRPSHHDFVPARMRSSVGDRLLSQELTRELELKTFERTWRRQLFFHGDKDHLVVDPGMATRWLEKWQSIFSKRDQFNGEWWWHLCHAPKTGSLFVCGCTVSLNASREYDL